VSVGLSLVHPQAATPMRDNDYNETISFLVQFFQFTDRDLEQIEFRAIANDGSGPRGRMHTRDPDRLLPFLQRYDVAGVAVYFGTCTRIGGAHQGRREHLASAVGLWVDIDCYKLEISVEDAVRALRQCPMPPTVIIGSGGGVHAYWLFREPLPVPMPEAGQPDEIKARIDAALGQLAGIFAGDPLPAQIAAVMRLPGTCNSKSGEMIPCVVLEASWTRYELDDLEEMLFQCRPLIMAPAGSETAPATASGAKAKTPADTDPFVAFGEQYAFKAPIDVEEALRLMAYGDLEHGIHRTQLRVSASLANTPGVSDDDIVEILMSHTERVAPPGARWNWEREAKNLYDMIRPIRERRRAEGKDPYPQAVVPSVPATPTGPPEGADPAKVIQLRPRKQAPPEPAVAASADYPFNDLGNAMRLMERHGSKLRYCVGVGWHVWDGKRFKPDPEDIRTLRLAQETVKAMLWSAFHGEAPRRDKLVKFAIQCGNAARIGNMVSLLKVQELIVVEANGLNADQMLLNCLNGTVDLRTGALRPHDPTDLLTKLAGVAYDPAAACPRWEQFLLEIFDGDTDLVGFVQRALGYSLSGSTKEQVVFILHGQGANGKTVLVDAVTAVIGDYVKHSPADTWVSRPAGAATNDLAALAGARFVSVVETERDRHLAEALVKQATGGDPISAKFHYQEYFEYWPQFKLWFATNNKPRIRGSDYAIWRRIMMLPFNVTFHDADKAVGDQKVKDQDLKNKLKQEYVGILAWMVRGCLEWQRIGLRPPKAVLAAVEAYQDSQDHMTPFVREACHESRGLSCIPSMLYEGYEVWCAENDQEPMSKREFFRGLDERGFPPGKRTMHARTRQGIDLRQEYKDAIAVRVKPTGGDGT
jgi:P4 family phage/plasmid primase-like protien